MNFQQSTQLPETSDFILSKLKNTTDREFWTVAQPSNKGAWYDEPTLTVGGQSSLSSFSVNFVTGMADRTTKSSLDEVDVHRALSPSKRRYQQHCILPAAIGEGFTVARVDFVSGMVVAFYGDCTSNISGREINTPSEGRSAMSVNGVAVYCTTSKTFFYSK